MINQIVTGQITQRKQASADVPYFKVRITNADGGTDDIFTYAPEGADIKWFFLLELEDIISVNVTQRSSRYPNTFTGHAICLQKQPSKLRKSISKRERDQHGRYTRVEGYLYADEHDDLKHALPLFKQIDPSIHFQDDLVRKFVLEGLERYRIARRLTAAAKT